MSRLSLRARLVLGVVALAAVGLLTADAVTYTSLRSFLIQRVDTGLEADHQGAEHAFGPSQGPGGPPGLAAGGTGADLVELRAPDGGVIYDSGPPHFTGTAAPVGPDLPANIAAPASPDRLRILTV